MVPSALASAYGFTDDVAERVAARSVVGVFGSSPSLLPPLASARRRATRAAIGALVGAFAGALVGGVASADAAQPTDFLSRVVSIDPDVAGVEARVVGGDAFIELTVDEGIDVMVLGYEGEPYLHFATDGTVSENVASPAHFLNEARYAAVDVPAGVDAASEPDWQTRADDGSWAWHDHRTHWMADTPPLGVEVGDQILDDVVPLVVDGAPVAVSVVSVWKPAPARWPSVLVALGAGLAVSAAVRPSLLRGRTSRPGGDASGERRSAVVVLVAAALAASIGLWQTWSLPSETGPPLSHWLLPVTALVAAVLALVWRSSPFTSLAAVVVSATQLVVWAVVRRAVLDHAILPTSAPFWFDRWGTAAVGAAALVVLVGAIATVVRSPGRLMVSPASAPR